MTSYKPLDAGWRVRWRKTRTSQVRYTVFYHTQREAEIFADKLVKDGMHIAGIEYKHNTDRVN